MAMQHPYKCPSCGKAAPKLTRVVWVCRADATIRGHDESWLRHLYVEQPLRSKADCERHTNQAVVSVSYSVLGAVTRFGEWDGESYWHRREPFCSDACCVRFARAAFNAGYRLKGAGNGES